MVLKMNGAAMNKIEGQVAQVDEQDESGNEDPACDNNSDANSNDDESEPDMDP